MLIYGPGGKKATAKFRNRGPGLVTKPSEQADPGGHSNVHAASSRVRTWNDSRRWHREHNNLTRGKHYNDKRSSGQHNYELDQSSRYSTTHLYCRKKEKSSIHHDDVMFCVIGGSWAKLSFVWTDYQNPSAGQWGLQHSQVISLVDTLNKESYACFSLKWNGRALLLVDNGHGQVPSAHSNRRLVLRAFPEWGFPIPN